MNKFLKRNIDIENRARRIPVCFCVDTSLSMDEIVEGEEYCKIIEKIIYGDQRKYKYMEPIIPNDSRVKTKADKLSDGIQNFYKAVRDDDMACDSCVSEIITFNDTAKVFETFDTVDNKEFPVFPNPLGNTNMTPAIRLALETLDEQKELYKNNKIAYFQPWLVIFTDGEPTDDITLITEELLNRQVADKLVVYVCPLTKDQYSLNVLQKLILPNTNSQFIPCDDPKTIKKFFTFLAKSVSASVNGLPSGFFDD